MKLKNLATCKPSEFLKQTSKIRKSVAAWLTATDILSIRKTLPKLEKIEDGMTASEKEAVAGRNRELLNAQAKSNAMKMLDAIMDQHPDETLELLALICFVEPEHVDDYPMDVYIEALSELISNEAVIGFFTSLAQLGQKSILTL